MGSETTTTFLRFLLLYMINFPSEQERLQAELDRVVGRDRAPALADARAGALPYTEAVIAEIQGRISSMTSAPQNCGGFITPPSPVQTLSKFCLPTNPRRTSLMNGPQRHATIVPFGVNHAPMADTTFAGHEFLRQVGYLL